MSHPPAESVGPLQANLLIAIEKAINQALVTQPDIRSLFAAHTGRLLAFHLNRPAFSCFALLVEDGVEIYHASEAIPDISIHASITDLLALVLSGNLSTAHIRERLLIEGNRELLADLLPALDRLSIDWQSTLAPWLDRDLLQKMETGRQHLAAWINVAGQQLKQQLERRLGGASPLLELRRDVYELRQDITELEYDIDRLQQRLSRLS